MIINEYLVSAMDQRLCRKQSEDHLDENEAEEEEQEDEEEEEEKEEEEEEEKKEGGSWSLGITAYLFIYL